MLDGDYAFLDAGDGRRLERFGELLADRPAPAHVEPRRAPERWSEATVYHPGSGWWAADGSPAPAADGAPGPDAGRDIRALSVAGLTLETRLAAGGQVGLFPEQLTNVPWLRDALRARIGESPTRSIEVLNLFAHTGLATLVAAGGGARVVHVDASRPAVAWARRNAELSGLADRPIRWIVDDALTFVRREARRGRRYAGLVLDPPSYGHGGRGGRSAWQFDEQIAELLDACARIAEPDAFWLLTAHTMGWDPERLATTLAAATDVGPGDLEARPLRLEAESGAVLDLGATARVDPLRRDRR
ncbi:MAG TPA: class I SAM-dependent methyltransferase [Candidatus Limnocylindrales bacterium]